MDKGRVVLPDNSYTCPFNLNTYDHVIHTPTSGLDNYICDQINFFLIEVNKINNKLLDYSFSNRYLNEQFGSICMMKLSSKEKNRIDTNQLGYEIYKTFLLMLEKELLREIPIEELYNYYEKHTISI